MLDADQSNLHMTELLYHSKQYGDDEYHCVKLLSIVNVVGRLGKWFLIEGIKLLVTAFKFVGNYSCCLCNK